MADRHSLESVQKAEQAPAGKPRDQRFGVPDQRSRHAATGRVALILLLCLATITIAIVAAGVNVGGADASGDIEHIQDRR